MQAVFSEGRCWDECIETASKQSAGHQVVPRPKQGSREEIAGKKAAEHIDVHVTGGKHVQTALSGCALDTRLLVGSVLRDDRPNMLEDAGIVGVPIRGLTVDRSGEEVDKDEEMQLRRRRRERRE